jgi:Ca-activated chloride channel family protein
MFKRTLPTLGIALALSGTLAVTGFAGGGSASACIPPAPGEPPASAPATTEAGNVDPDGRCDIDAEAYYLEYSEGDYDMATTTAGAPGVPVVAPTAADAELAAEAPPPPIVIIDEPGPLDDNTFVDAGDSLWVATDDDRESTFALDVDTGSYNVAQQFLATGYRPEPDSIRPEEWVNAFTYGDDPASADDLALHVESGGVDGTALVRVGVTTRELSAAERPAANITFVIDTSGSMDIRERLGLVKASLALLVKNLRVDDTISIVTYGDDARPVLPPTPVAEWPDIVEAIDALGPGGSTNMEAGLLLGYEQARDAYDPDALNVVVLASDGVANVGVTDADVLTDTITQAGDEGIHLVTVGYGMGNYNDHLMEQLANQGDGFYSYVDTFAEAVELFVEDLTPTLTVVAEEAKIQVVFDEDVVSRYRLIGYENRSLDDDQFTDDTVDAGELGAGHQVSAVYEVELVDGTENSEAEAGEVRLRWRSTDSGEVTELRQPLVVDADAESSPTLRFATLVAHTAEVLRGNSAVAERGLTLDDLLAEADALAAAGVEGAGEVVELLSTAIHAVDPVEGVR